MPSLFIAHGAPLLAIQDNEYTRFLSQLGQTLPRPKAVVILSAHWLDRTQQVSEVKRYDTIYDFGGFPEELYRIQYPAQGDFETSREVEALLDTNGIAFDVETKRGLDHGAWVVLRLLYPDAGVPVVAMSVNPHLSPKEQYHIGTALSALRNKDVLVIGSGGTVHNLRALQWNADKVDDWALGFDEWLHIHLNRWDLDALFDYEGHAPYAHMAVPMLGNEHFVPIFYAMGAANDQRRATLLHRSYQYGNLSQSVWQFG